MPRRKELLQDTQEDDKDHADNADE